METPTLARVIMDAIESRLVEVHVSLPATIVEYDSKEQKASVQVDIQRTYITGESAAIPVLMDLPVAWPRAGKAYLHMPLKAGDQVQVVFSERSLDEWKESGGSTVPEAHRKHSLSDGWVVPGGYPFSNPMTKVDSTSVFLTNDKTEFKLTPGGQMSLKGNGGEELLKILFDFMEVASRATTNTMLGPMRWNETEEIKAIMKRLGKIKL